MKTALFALSGLLLCTACDNKVDQNPKIAQSKIMEVSSCRSVVFENNEFTDCVATPQNHQIRMYLNDISMSPYRSLSALKSGLGDRKSVV